MNDQNLLSCNVLKKSYTQGNNKINILNGINLEVLRGQTISITGSSGSGKSTLLHIIAGLDSSDSGNIIFNGKNLNNLSEKQMCILRNKYYGFVYQFHHLLPEFTAIENILMPLIIRGKILKSETARAHDLLSYLKLDHRINNYPGQLSGGERQRVAIARALINNPLLVFADEPTGNLDNFSSDTVMEIFFRLQKEINTSLIIVTHNAQIAKSTNLQYFLKDGLLHSDLN